MWVTFKHILRWVPICSISVTTNGLFVVLKNGKKILIDDIHIEVEEV